MVVASLLRSSEPADSSPDTVLRAGPKIDRYALIDLIGRGAMGEVFAAYDPDLNRRVAIKLLRKQASDKGKELFKREGRILARLRHPHVVSVLDTGTFEERPYLVMEYVAGTTLRRWLKERRPPEQIIRALVRVGQALEAAHRVNVLHRDIKPDNILIDQDGYSYLSDFGFGTGSIPSGEASVEGENTSTRGTPGYMAPELFQGGSQTVASDQYAFAINPSGGLGRETTCT